MSDNVLLVTDTKLRNIMLKKASRILKLDKKDVQISSSVEGGIHTGDSGVWFKVVALFKSSENVVSLNGQKGLLLVGLYEVVSGKFILTEKALGHNARQCFGDYYSTLMFTYGGTYVVVNGKKEGQGDIFCLTPILDNPQGGMTKYAEFTFPKGLGISEITDLGTLTVENHVTFTDHFTGEETKIEYERHLF